ncbi:MAG: EamA family transporter [Pseudonocardiaceae bacterium]
MYLGAALAVLLFDRFSPAGVAWLRMLVAALVLLAWRRPDRAAWRGSRLILAGGFGLVTGLMNVAFYEAIARLPLGTAVAVEFCGPIVVAAMGLRSVRGVVALILAATGVALIADVRVAGSRTGLLLALLAALMWAAYIVLGKWVAHGGHGLDDMTVGFTLATVLLCPLAAGTGPVWGSPTLLVMTAGVGVLSTVLPYALDQMVLRRAGQARFALLLALLPATASVIGFLALGQLPHPLEAAGIVAVGVGVGVHTVGSRARCDGDIKGVLRRKSSASGSRRSPPPATR